MYMPYLPPIVKYAGSLFTAVTFSYDGFDYRDGFTTEVK